MDARELRIAREEELEALRNSYRFYKSTQGIDCRIQHMITIKAKGEALSKELDKIPVVPTLFELAKQDEEKIMGTVQLMIINVVEYYKTSELMKSEMVEEVALRIIVTFGGLTLEDVALCFHRAKNGQLGQIYNRIDGGVIMEWLLGYQEEVQNIGMERNRRLHNQGKTGIWKEGHEYRILKPKRLTELM